MDNFIALDVETANCDTASICQIGIASFEDGKLTNTWKTLVDPEDYFDEFNTLLHGISWEMVQGSPTYKKLHIQLGSMLGENIVVHHSPFDRTSFNQAAEKYNLDPINCQWLDTARVVRRHWEEFRHQGYNLPGIAAHIGLPEYKIHDALEDAITAGLLMIHISKESNTSISDWSVRAYNRMQSGPGEFDSIVNANPDPDGPLYGEVIVFTGALSITRLEAARMAFKAGCDVNDSVSKKVTLLVVGDQDAEKLAGFSKSSKHRKAEQLISEGCPIRILAEKDFIEMVNY